MDAPGSPPLRALFVNRMACLERGGGETFDLEMARHLEKLGVRTSFLSGAPLFGAPALPLGGGRLGRNRPGLRLPPPAVEHGFHPRP